MLLIRESQIQVFRDSKWTQFADRLRSRLGSEFPEALARLGEEGLDEAIGYGASRAGSFGFHSGPSIYRFLCLQLLLGRDFDQQQRNAWMSDLLDPDDDASPERRMEWLYDGVIARSQNTYAGNNGA